MNYRLVSSSMHARLFYDPDTGEFLRQFSSGRIERNIGRLDKDGYVRISIFRVNKAAHRVAFEAMGLDVPEQVDHVNGVKSDNRWSNLRAADASKNGSNKALQSNNKSGVKGVYFCSHSNLYVAQVWKNRKRNRKHFKTLNEADKWAKQQREELHKEFANHGKHSKH